MSKVVIYKHFLGANNAQEVKAFYRKLVFTHHPDKGGNENTFKEVVAEYEILSEPTFNSYL